MKLKDYEIPHYGLNGGLDPEDLDQYSLKNFDLKAYRLSQQQPDPEPLVAPCDPSLFEQHTDSTAPRETPSPDPPSPTTWSATPEPPDEPGFSHAPNPVHMEPNPYALDPADVQFGPHFNLQTVAFTPLSPAQSWKIPRWVVGMVGLFFGSAAVLMIAFCVVLLRDPNPAPTGPASVPTAAVATTSVAAPARPASSSTTSAAPAVVAPAASAAKAGPAAAAVRHSGPATASLTQDDAALGHRFVVSRHRSVVRRQLYGPRRVASKSTSPSVAAQETETTSRRPPQDALDQLLSESSL